MDKRGKPKGGYDEDIDTNSINSNVGQVTFNTPKGPMTRARARQLNIEVKSLLLESRLDISESWILPHAPYLCLISFAGEDGKRNDDRETKECLLFSDQTGLTAGQTGQTDASAAEPLDRSDRPWRRSDRHLLGFVQRGSLLVLSGISAQVHWRSDRPQRRSDRRSWSLGVRPSQLAVRPPASAVRPAPAVRPVRQHRSDRPSWSLGFRPS